MADRTKNPLPEADLPRANENRAIRRGQIDLTLATFVGFILTTVGMYSWLNFVDIGSPQFDVAQRLHTFGCLLGDTDKRALPLLAAFSAVAIALAVALSSALNHLDSLDERGPTEDVRAPVAEIRPNDADSIWISRRTTLIALIFAEMLLTVAATSWAALYATWFITRGEPAIAAVALILAVFLLIETIRCLAIIRFRPPNWIVPLPSDIASRLTRLSANTSKRARYSFGWWIGWCASAVAGWALFSDHLTIVAMTQLAFFFGVGIAALYGRDAVTASRGSRGFTIFGSCVFAMLPLFVLYSTALVAAASSAQDEALLWRGLAVLVAMLALLAVRVFDEAGMPTARSRTLGRRRWGSAPPSDGSTPPSVAKSLATSALVSLAAVGLLGIASGPGLILAFATIASTLVATLSRWSKWRKVILALTVLAVAILACAVNPPRETFAALWAAITILAACSTHLRTRTGRLLVAAPDRWMAWLIRRRSDRWTQQMKMLGLAIRHAEGGDRYEPESVSQDSAG